MKKYQEPKAEVIKLAIEEKISLDEPTQGIDTSTTNPF